MLSLPLEKDKMGHPEMSLANNTFQIVSSRCFFLLLTQLMLLFPNGRISNEILLKRITGTVLLLPKQENRPRDSLNRGIYFFFFIHNNNCWKLNGNYIREREN